MRTCCQLVFMWILLTSCKTKNVSDNSLVALYKCPTEGSCSFEVLKDTALLVMEDEFKNSYYQLKSAKGRLVLKFEYSKNEDPQLADDSYSEIIFIEIDDNVNELKLTDELLTEAKVSFSRMCFCRGSTGLYNIRKGRLHIYKHLKGFQVTLNFEINEVPHVITSFTAYFEL